MKRFNYDDDDDWFVKTSVRNSSGGGTRFFLKKVLQKEISIEQKSPLSKMKGNRGYNRCKWLMTGRTETCGKSCREEYCKIHRLQIRRGSVVPLPCQGCGVGVRSDIQLCGGCGRETERKRLEKFYNYYFIIIICTSILNKCHA